MVIEEHRDIAKEQLQIQKDIATKKLSEEQKECHRAFRLTSDSKDDTYEWYKDRVEERAENTCLWFLKHENFQKWMNQESGPLLVTADPGCGKSVLAKYLIDHKLPQSATICYFFFKDQEQNTSRQALCALLHQLFSQKPSLLKHAMPQFNSEGVNISQATAPLWEILRAATGDPEAGHVIIVLDALDECTELEVADFIRNVGTQFGDGHPGSKLKYLLTCRPYEQITSQFYSLLNSFPDIRIPGEEESEAISQEIGYVITHRINQLSTEKNLSPEIKSSLATRLQSISHRTYLWIYLTFKHLEQGIFKKTLKGIESAIATLPNSINEAYERILSKTKERPTVQKALSILLAAQRPLTLAEMNVAVNLVETAQNTYDLDLEDAESFKLRIRSLCGLFIAIHHNKVYFLHQTAREFLLTKLTSPSTTLVSSSWQHSITLRRAHAILAELCVIYLDLFNSGYGFLKDVENFRQNDAKFLEFLDYSARNWSTHLYKAEIDDHAAILPLAMRICDPNSTSYSLWYKLHQKDIIRGPSEGAPELLFASHCGLTSMVKLCLEQACNIEAISGHYSSLQWAIYRGHKNVIKLLLERGANTEVKDFLEQTPIFMVASEGWEDTVKLLLGSGADAQARDYLDQTPLFHAAFGGCEGVVRLLLEKGSDIEAKDDVGQTPLLCAILHGRESVARLLLEKGANVEVRNGEGETPLHLAVARGHEGIVKMLLEQGANIQVTNKQGRTPLQQAILMRREAVVELMRMEEAKLGVERSHSPSFKVESSLQMFV